MPEVAKPGKPTMSYLGQGKVWTTPSKSTPGKWYITIYNPDTGMRDCTCPGWKFQKKCWHLEQATGADLDTEFQINL